MQRPTDLLPRRRHHQELQYHRRLQEPRPSGDSRTMRANSMNHAMYAVYLLSSVDMGGDSRRLHLRMPLSPRLLYRHHLREPQEVQVYIPLRLPCNTIGSSVETNRRAQEASRARDYVLGRCGADMAVQL
jgi:hypothetical protein